MERERIYGAALIIGTFAAAAAFPLQRLNYSRGRVRIGTDAFASTGFLSVIRMDTLG